MIFLFINIYISSLCFEQYQTVMVVDTTETDQVIKKVEVMVEQEEPEIVTEHQDQEERMAVIVSESRISPHLLISIMASYCTSYLGHNIIHLINAFK